MELVRDELQRFRKVFLSYTKVVIGGMLLATLFFFFYAGVKANYIFIVILAAVFSTLSACIACVTIYVYTPGRQKKEKLEKELKKVESALEVIKLQELNEELESQRREIFEKVQELTPSELRSIVKINESHAKDAAYEFALFRGMLLIIFLIDMIVFLSGAFNFFTPHNKEDVRRRIVE